MKRGILFFLAVFGCAFAACNPSITTQLVPAECVFCSDDGQCIDLLDDPNHCGTCTTKCIAPSASDACSKGACTYGACTPGLADCDGDIVNGCERSIDGDTQNCGGCGIVCDPIHATGACIAGTCTYTACNANFEDCDGNKANGCEVATAIDASHCGGCNIRCSNGNICINGVCTDVSPIVGPTSYAYPTDNNGGVVAPDTFILTIQSVMPAVIFYTMNGTTPTYASNFAQSPLTLTITNTGVKSNTVVQWFTTIDETVMVHNATIDPSEYYVSLSIRACAGAFVQNVRWDSTNGPVVIASPGQTLTGKVDYRAWNTYLTYCPACPGCVPFAGYGVLATEGCYLKSTWTWNWTPNDVSIHVTAPSQPGLYKLRRSMQFDVCTLDVGVSGDDGTIIVQ
ncbi:MAG: chitobiase/beta-hexosaminidase C-terminal domain-containing protein [Polyangiaceae bacterium]|nr:chitobiase/beta-hexosaminidase C-terminal domain-containing protein [Polyangiaceae bacterium]